MNKKQKFVEHLKKSLNEVYDAGYADGCADTLRKCADELEAAVRGDGEMTNE